MSEEFELDPVPGLPENLPKGETLLWQGSPSWTSAARHIMHVTAVAAYFAALAIYFVVDGWTSGAAPLAIAATLGRVTIVASIAIGLLALLGWLTARTTIYSITSRRIVMRYGIALPVTLNLPFSKVASIDLKRHADGTGDLAIAIPKTERLGFSHLWPHVRPWTINHPRPSLRSLPEIEQVSAMLCRAMADAARERGDARITVAAPELRERTGYTGPGVSIPA